MVIIAGLFAEWDGVAFSLVRMFAERAYPKLPAGADEALLRSEAQLVTDSMGDRFNGLCSIASSERRDLGAVALSPWASTVGGLANFGGREFGAIRLAAIKAAGTSGTPPEAAAARAYMGVVEVLPAFRILLLNAVNAACQSFNVVDAADVMPSLPDDGTALLEWAEMGPQDAAPDVKSIL